MKFVFPILMLVSASVVNAEEIEWKVNNPFRLVNYDNSESAFRINSGQSAFDFVTKMASSDTPSYSPPIKHTNWNSDTTDVRRFSEDYIFPESQPVEASLTKVLTGECLWRYQETIQQMDCSESFIFDARTQYGSGDPTLTVTQKPDGPQYTIEVSVYDKLVLGLGDSYASGEGNPDIPTRVNPDGIAEMARVNKNRNLTGRWMNKTEYWLDGNARWFDKQCHRSFFSQHILASMRLAESSPHESLTMIPLACSGAEVLDGLLIAQESPPGGGKSVIESQINSAVRHLCRNSDLRSVKKLYYRGYTSMRLRQQKMPEILRCDGELRKPDAVLLSIGGNDVGFAPALSWAILPHGHRNPAGLLAVSITQKATDPVCPKYTGQRICITNSPVAKDRVKEWLPDYYRYLADQLSETGLVVDPQSVFLTAYPNPIFIEDGATLCGEDRSEDMIEQARSRLPRAFVTPKWDLKITSSEMHDINVGIINPLYEEMKASALKYGWTFVDAYINPLKKHGICAGYARKNSQIPIYPHVRKGGVWTPKNPSEIKAYDNSRMRWFRNTNDSVLFQTDDTTSGMNGAFHPDYRIHAVVADQLFENVSKYWRQE